MDGGFGRFSSFMAVMAADTLLCLSFVFDCKQSEYDGCVATDYTAKHDDSVTRRSFDEVRCCKGTYNNKN